MVVTLRDRCFGLKLHDMRILEILKKYTMDQSSFKCGNPELPAIIRIQLFARIFNLLGEGGKTDPPDTRGAFLLRTLNKHFQHRNRLKNARTFKIKKVSKKFCPEKRLQIRLQGQIH